MSVYDKIKSRGKKLAILIDPDKPTEEQVTATVDKANRCGVDFIFVGGSLLTTNSLDGCIKLIKQNTKIPVVIFPGDSLQISSRADAFMLLSLISGRNAEMLIGRHVVAAPYLKTACSEIIPVGYMIIDSGRPTSVSYMSGTIPIPYHKNDIAMCTALAGEMLGLKMIYLEAGSNAEKAVSAEMIKAVKNVIKIPLIVGGGIRTPEQAAESAKAGADVIVLGSVIERTPDMLNRFAEAIHGLNE